jgi:hypothetical protein
MGTDYTLQKCRSPESSRPYTENGVKKSGNFGLIAGLITHRYSLDQFAGLMDHHQPDAIKEVIEWA